MEKLTNDQLIKWNINPLYNPLSGRKIKNNGPTYKTLKKLYNKRFINKEENYNLFRIDIIDPILLVNLPINNLTINDLFKFDYIWNPYSGNRFLKKDDVGPLYFDPNSLIHYFYINRLNNIWISESYEDGYFIQGHYGDAIGKYPKFTIKSRGDHPEWYLFRLPIIDCYLNKNHYHQSITMGPILNDDEIKKNYNLAKKNKNIFFDTYKYKLPNLIKLKELYDLAVNPLDEYDKIYKNNFSNNEINKLKFKTNINAVNKLIKFK